MFRTLAIIAALSIVAPASAQLPKAYNLKPVDLKEPILWGSTCEGPNGFVLAFGGCDQNGDKPPRTRYKVADRPWETLAPSIEKDNKCLETLRRCIGMHRANVTRARKSLFSGGDRPQWDLVLEVQRVAADYAKVALIEIERATGGRPDATAKGHFLAALPHALEHTTTLLEAKSFEEAIVLMGRNIDYIEQTLSLFEPEPPPRCLSPLVFDKKTGLFVLFGGDHLDYLTNDLWVFDPVKTSWQRRHPKNPPAPRANHRWTANGEGKVTVHGGYTYTSSTSYLSAQYRDVGDGQWTYDIVADQWTGTSDAAEPDMRVFRTGPFHPDFFVQEPRPDSVKFSDWLEKIPKNHWIEVVVPYRPELCRTWGHAVFDAAGDQILVFGGGHSAHGGSDVLHFHLSTGRWELPFPVEFPLGQLYSNTEYPRGFNLNGRPWVTGHTYQSYQVDPVSRRMLFVGQPADCYVYSPQKGDWDGRIPRPKKMMYNDAFYTLQLVPSKTGLICWTGRGDLFQFDGKTSQWSEIAHTGDKLPNSVVDNSSFALDTKRNRLLLFRGEYGKPYSGEVVTVDLRTGETKKRSPAGMNGLTAARFGAADHVVYDPANDLIIFSEPLPGPAGAVRRTLAFDCANDRWMSFELGYEIGKDKRPSHPRGPGHSCGLIHDARRGILWGVNTHDCRVYALRLDPKTADPRPFE